MYILWSHTLWNNDHLHLTICVMLFFFVQEQITSEPLVPGYWTRTNLKIFRHAQLLYLFFFHLLVFLPSSRTAKVSNRRHNCVKNILKSHLPFLDLHTLIINFLAKLSRVATIYNQEYFAFPSYDSKLVEYRDRFFFLNCKNSLHICITLHASKIIWPHCASYPLLSLS